MGRAFIAAGRWRGIADQACDAVGQKQATLRVSALAGLATLALIAGPGFPEGQADDEPAPIVRVAMPEIVAAKPADRVPSLDETTSAFRRKPRPAPEPVAATPAPEPAARIEILDAATLRAGAMTVRIAGIAPPSPDRTCRRLDGQTESCLDRAASYLELLVRNRAVACDRAGLAADGVEQGRCRIGDADIAEQMLRQGWAEATDRDTPRLVLAEAQAKRQKLGLWRE